MRTVKVNDTELAYVEQGEGEPVVFVHGGVNDLRAWRHQMDVFGAEMRAVALSCRHYHPNDPPSDSIALPLSVLADDLAAFLDALDLAPAHLVGSSSGAFVCLITALNHPERVQSLVLGEPPVLSLLGVSVPPKPSELLKLLFRSPGAAAEVVKFGASGIGPAIRAFSKDEYEKGVWTFIRAAVGPETADKLEDVTERQMYDNARTFEAQLRAGFPPISDSDARGLDVPTLLVTGEKSNPVHHRITDRLERLLSDVERIDLRDASHLMYADQPEAFNRAALGFVRQHAG